jgi:hypothetical protein
MEYKLLLYIQYIDIQNPLLSPYKPLPKIKHKAGDNFPRSNDATTGQQPKGVKKTLV